MVEGDVNAKNSLGAYTGFKHFYAVNGFSYLSDSLTPLTNNGKTYSYAYQLSLASTKGPILILRISTAPSRQVLRSPFHNETTRSP